VTILTNKESSVLVGGLGAQVDDPAHLCWLFLEQTNIMNGN
jgi:hypothetical protein